MLAASPRLLNKRTVSSDRWDTGGDGHRRIMAKHRVGVEPPFLSFFGTAVFVALNGGLDVCDALVPGRRGSVMSVSVHSVHHSIVPHTATARFVWMGIAAMTSFVIPSTCRETSPEGQACPIVQDEAEGE